MRGWRRTDSQSHGWGLRWHNGQELSQDLNRVQLQKKHDTSTKSATSCKMLPSRQYIAGKGTGKAPPNRGTHARFFLILPYTAYTIPHCGTHHSNFHFSFDTRHMQCQVMNTEHSVGISGKQQLGTTKSAASVLMPCAGPLLLEALSLFRLVTTQGRGGPIMGVGQGMLTHVLYIYIYIFYLLKNIYTCLNEYI